MHQEHVVFFVATRSVSRLCIEDLPPWTKVNILAPIREITFPVRTCASSSTPSESRLRTCERGGTEQVLQDDTDKQSRGL